MKKIFTLLMLLCTISVFAANAAGTYTGRLTISVDGNAPTVKDGQNVIVTESDIVTLTIPDFSYSGYPKADVNLLPQASVVITASKDAAGNLTLKTIKYGFLRLSAKFNDGSKVSDNNCNISLSISAVLQKVEVTFVGTK